MVIGTGVDIVSIARFKSHVDKLQNNIKTRFLERVFSSHEQEYIIAKNEKGRPQTMAGLFAAKEAVAKVLGIGFNGFSPCHIEIWHTSSGRPYVKLHKIAVQAYRKTLTNYRGGRTFAIQMSISHSGKDAIAFAILENRERHQHVKEVKYGKKGNNRIILQGR